MLPIDRWLDRYQIEASLGGSHCAVYRAQDLQTQTRVCLKVLRPEVLDSDASFHAFWSDTHARSTLLCPALPAVQTYGLAPLPYSVSEWVEGFPLHILFGAGDAALGAGLSAVCEAMETLAAAGLLAADCHPTNWLLAANRAVYVDCGDVAWSGDASSLRRDLGNLFYFMAAGREASGHWSDTFAALGCNVPQAPDVMSLRPELKTSGPLIEQLRRGEPIAKPQAATLVDASAAPLAPYGRVVETSDVRPYLTVSGALRLSGVARIDVDGFVHVSRFSHGIGKRGPDRLRNWLDAHAFANQPLVVVCENATHADAETRKVLDDLRARTQHQPLLLVIS